MARQPGRRTRAVVSTRRADPPVDLILYISQRSRHTPVARRNCEALLARFDRRAVRFEVCDVSAHPERAEEDAVMFTPMLVKRQPPPRTFVVGDLSDAAPLIYMLESCGVRPTR